MKKKSMIDLQGFARLAVGALDAADRAEARGKLYEAKALRELSWDMERFLVRMAQIPDWTGKS